METFNYSVIKSGMIKSSQYPEFNWDGTTSADTNFLQSLYEKMKVEYPKYYKMNELCQSGVLSALLSLPKNYEVDYDPDKLGLIVQNNSSSLVSDFPYSKEYYCTREKIYQPKPSLFTYTLPNILIGEICIKQKLLGENFFFISEEFDLEPILDEVRFLFETGVLEGCLIGWAEVNPDNINNFFFFLTPDSFNNHQLGEQINQLYFH
ncbi:hypothetical protein JKA74_09665 [Marivirga sp. S37H4]|uniref:3-oxoacyl-ACP synthase n=1 Tax=Marivirga aurantiaca TaxID=2802615 RepID=A0A934WYM8_9BACT|nr:hypothetical protein [Marivirga aurantiaca]MBK6265307.1 hypothetical protein [Marivirga aurantiaca]